MEDAKEERRRKREEQGGGEEEEQELEEEDADFAESVDLFDDLSSDEVSSASLWQMFASLQDSLPDFHSHIAWEQRKHSSKFDVT